MKDRICTTASGVGMLIALLALPAAATAKGGTFVIGPSRTAQLQLKGSHRYSISVIGEGDEVSLTAMHGGSSATYTTRGIASATRLKARFGTLGLLAMRFHADGRPRRVPVASGNCHGKGEVVNRGHWVGRIEFEGEEEYTTVRASRAKGKVTKSFKETCRRTKAKTAVHPASK